MSSVVTKTLAKTLAKTSAKTFGGAPPRARR